jgi:NADH:ubiquinone oxidoreductase subunit F (NADH-binding)
MMLSSLCGLGQAAPNPIMDSLQHFRAEYESRVAK